MVSLSVLILPTSSLPSPGPAVTPNDIRVLNMRWFWCAPGARERSKVSVCDYPHDGAASPARALLNWFRIDSVANEVATGVSRKPLLGLGIAKPFAPFSAKAAGIRSNKMKDLSLLECALTKGVHTLFRVQSTSFFVSFERKCHNGLVWGRHSIYPQSLRQRGRHGQR
jgi:hypothetical protein